ncbi:hypothetical protein EV126DRAFT_413802 [Verticillium dahliae]|nr:hypothetical protein EV126DRAFT_413802 [Verticillium dahliae]
MSAMSLKAFLGLLLSCKMSLCRHGKSCACGNNAIRLLLDLGPAGMCGGEAEAEQPRCKDKTIPDEAGLSTHVINKSVRSGQQRRQAPVEVEMLAQAGAGEVRLSEAGSEDGSSFP